MKYPKEYLDEIKLRLKVSHVVGKSVKLKKRGKEFIGLSPFSNEKTPSFTVKEGVFSLVNGEIPINSLPLFFKLTDLATTVETFNLNLISSKYSFGYFMSLINPLLLYLLSKNQQNQNIFVLVVP